MCCFGKTRDYSEEDLTDGKLLEKRHCTDCLCIIIFLVFCIIWGVLLAIAIANGHPSRILLPSDYTGKICGDDKNYVDYPNYFVPLPNRIRYGICVSECPQKGDYVCNNEEEETVKGGENKFNTYYNHTNIQYNEGKDALEKCMTGACSPEEKTKATRFAGLLVRLKEFKCFRVSYGTKPTLFRCLPFDLGEKIDSTENVTKSTLRDLSEKLGVGSFFMRGFGECKQCWIPILICCFTACILSLLWVFLLRFILAPFVYLCMILIFVLLVIVGILCLLQARDLEKHVLPGERGTDDQVKVWKAAGYILFLVAAMYVIIVLVLLKRIRIAIILMEESSKAFSANPCMVFIPIFTLILVVAFAIMFFYTTINIQTMGKLEEIAMNETVEKITGNDNLYTNAKDWKDKGLTKVDQAANTLGLSRNITSTTFNTTASTKALHAYNFFMFLWTMNLCIMFGFFVMALIVCTWYFSALGTEIDQYERENKKAGRLKETKRGTFCKALCVSLRYHLGSILFGALLIAIIQFIRAVVLYIEKEFLEKWKSNATIKCFIYILNCCLACIERVIRAITKSAFVIVVVKNKSFCTSAFEGLSILVSNIVRAGTLQFLSTVSCTLLKVIIVGLNLTIGFGLIKVKKLTDDKEVESGLFPLLFIFVLSFVICSPFISVFESCVDSIMMCFFLDEKDFNGRYMPPKLAKLMGQFKQIEEARRKYEENIQQAGTKDVELSS